MDGKTRKTRMRTEPGLRAGKSVDRQRSVPTFGMLPEPSGGIATLLLLFSRPDEGLITVFRVSRVSVHAVS